MEFVHFSVLLKETIDSSNKEYALSLGADKDISNQVDKFWLMSLKETEMFFKDQMSKSWQGNNGYWLRSPILQGELSVYFIENSGAPDTNYAYASHYVRPCFKIA